MDKKAAEKAKAQIIQLVSPGTPFREGLDNVLRANTGGLIVVGYNDKVKSLVDGGFKIGCPFSPSYLYELAKMDGAIILNEKVETIVLANAHLVPDKTIPSMETGMRHRTAERIAKETKALVIAISQRRNIITLYQGNFRYVLRELSVILTKANQAMQTLERYRSVLQESIHNLSKLEFEEMVTYADILYVMQRLIMVMRIKTELLIYMNELGVEGRLLRLQLHEMLHVVEQEVMLVLKDYTIDPEGLKPEQVFQAFVDLSYSETVEDTAIMKTLGYTGFVPLEQIVSPCGYRALHKIPRLPFSIIHNLVKRFGKLSNLLNASVEELDDVEGIGEVRAKKIHHGLRHIKTEIGQHSL